MAKIIDQKMARDIYSGFKSIPDYTRFPEVETFFFADNNFEPCFRVALPTEGRSFYISKDDRFYFSPDWKDPKYHIYDCNKILDVQLEAVGLSDSAIVGAMIAGVAGAVVGASSKKISYAIRIKLDDSNVPIIFSMLIWPIKSNTPEYRDMLNISEKIIRRLSEYIKPKESLTDSASGQNENNLGIISPLNKAAERPKLEKMIVTTSSTVEGYRIKEYLGIVTGANTCPAGGLNGEEQNRYYSEVVHNSRKQIKRQAENMGAQAVISLQVAAVSLDNIGDILVTLTGTAVTLE